MSDKSLEGDVPRALIEDIVGGMAYREMLVWHHSGDMSGTHLQKLCPQYLIRETTPSGKESKHMPQLKVATEVDAVELLPVDEARGPLSIGKK